MTRDRQEFLFQCAWVAALGLLLTGVFLIRASSGVR